MKKAIIISLIILSIVLISIVSIFYYFSYPERTKRATVILGESQKFSQSEVEAATKCVREYFLGRDDMYLKKLWYNEESSNNTVRSYIANGVDEANIIVLFTDHHTGKGYITGPNMDYEKYVWILIRDNKTDDWKISDSGVV